MSALFALAVSLIAQTAYAGFYIEEGVVERPAKQQSDHSAEAAKPQQALDAAASDASSVASSTKVQPKSESKNDAKKVAPPVWVARKGTTLRKTIEEWCRILNWTVIWQPSDLDYANPATRTFEGGFEDAVKQLFQPYKNAKRPLLVDGWRGNSVIVVSEKK